MAYVPFNQQREEDPNKAPVLSGGAPTSSAQPMQANNSAEAKQNTSKAPGTGFVNLERMLTPQAQAQQRERIAKARDDVFADQRKEFEGASSGLNSFARNQKQYSGQDIQGMFNQSQDSEISDVLSKKTNKPEFSYEESSDIKNRVGLLGNRNTVSQAAIGNNSGISAPSYSFGQQNLDRAFVDGDSVASGLVDGIGGGLSAQKGAQTARISDLNAAIESRANYNRNSATSALNELARNQEKNVDDRIAKWEEAKTAEISAPTKPKFSDTDPLNQYVQEDSRGASRSYGAINKEESDYFSRLSKLLGDDFKPKEYNTEEIVGGRVGQRQPVYKKIEQKNAWEDGKTPRKNAYSPSAHNEERHLLSVEQNKKVDELVAWLKENNDGSMKVDWQNIYRWAETGDPAYISDVSNKDPYRWSFDPKNPKLSRASEDPSKTIGRSEGTYIEPVAYSGSNFQNANYR